MIPSVTRRAVYPLLQQWRGEKIYSHLKSLEKTQWLKTEQIKELQWQGLRQLLKTVYERNQFYRVRLERARITVNGEVSLNNFSRIPILEKEDLRASVRAMVSKIPGQRIESRKTSGSTGVPLEILKSRDSYGRNRAIFHRYYAWYGIGIGDKQVRFFGHPVTFAARFKEDIQDLLLNKYRLDPVNMSDVVMGEFYKKLIRVKPDYFYGYPSAIYEFGKFLERTSRDAAALKIKTIIATGETLYSFQRQALERIFKARVVNEYGCSECGIIAFECPKGRLHLSSDNLYVEVIKDDKAAQSSEVGEVVITELYNTAVPLIRYRIGDLVRVSKDPYCSCGRGLPCIDAVEGRASQFIELPDGRKVHTELFHYISDGLTQIKQFRVIHYGGVRFTIEYACDEGTQGDVTQYIAHQIKKYLGEDVELTFSKVQSIPRDCSGKLRYFVSELSR